jgi:hypothetical protein
VAENDELKAAASCDVCGDQGPLLLKSRCHLTAPLQAVLEGETLILRCYLPECGKEVVRFQVTHPPLTRELTESQLSLLNDVAGLCHSEANRWERSAPKTAEHWRNAAIELQATYLAAHAMHTEEYEPYMPAGTYFQDDLDGGRLVRKPPLHDKLPLTRERVEAAVRELFTTRNGASSGRVMELLRDDRLTIRQFTPSVMTDELCRLLGVEDE